MYLESRHYSFRQVGIYKAVIHDRNLAVFVQRHHKMKGIVKCFVACESKSSRDEMDDSLESAARQIGSQNQA
jgi:hypothetical protein